MLRVELSIIIACYNYERFVGEAIDSALSVVCSSKEIIVIDDGSTDGSLDVIRSYNDPLLKSIVQRNSGPASAYQAGYNVSNGRYVIFLDADDLLEPSVFEQTRPLFNPGVCKVQYQMQPISATGLQIGSPFPHYRDCGDEISHWFSRSTAYPTPPTSGNIYTREFTDYVFPIDLQMDRAIDSYLLPLAPIYGKIVSLRRVLAHYRIHGSNLGASAELDESKFPRELERAKVRATYARLAAEELGKKQTSDIYKSQKNVVMRAFSFVLNKKSHPEPHDSRYKIIRAALSAVFTPQGLSLSHNLIGIAIIIVTLVSPKLLVRLIARWRYVPQSRPTLINSFLAK